MATFKLEICTDNAAFGDYPEGQLAIILQGLVNAIHSLNDVEHTLLDTNGNIVGKSYYD